MNTISYKDLPAMLDVKQAAQILNCSPRTVSRMCTKGDLKAVKIIEHVASQSRCTSSLRWN